MTPAWKDFERLVARIEEAMAPMGATVKSPDRIIDKETGQSREVDAAIRYTVGTVPVLITIESRDRVAIQDVTWIEQLIAKRHSVGAAITVAVSSKGFTGPAVNKAAAAGIQIRTLTEATADEFVQWLRFQTVVRNVNECSLADFGIGIYDGPNGPPSQKTELTAEAQKSFREQQIRAPILIRNSDGNRYHIENFLIEWEKHNGSFFPPNLPTDGTKARRNLHQPLPPNAFHVETTAGNYDVKILHISLWLSCSQRLVSPSTLAQYSDRNALLVQTAEWMLTDNVRLSLHRDLTSGETKVRMTSSK